MPWYNPATWFNTAETGIKMADKMLDGGMKALDALWHTDEEKAEDKQKIMVNYLNMLKTTANESTTKSKTRRYLAIMIIGNALVMSWCTILFKLIAIFKESEKADKAATFIFEMMKEFWYAPVIAVVIFYFGYYAWMNIKKAKKG